MSDIPQTLGFLRNLDQNICTLIKPIIELRVDDTVLLNNLKQAKALNGHIGLLLHKQQGRWGVNVQTIGKCVKVKDENIIFIHRQSNTPVKSVHTYLLSHINSYQSIADIDIYSVLHDTLQGSQFELADFTKALEHEQINGYHHMDYSLRHFIKASVLSMMDTSCLTLIVRTMLNSSAFACYQSTFCHNDRLPDFILFRNDDFLILRQGQYLTRNILIAQFKAFLNFQDSICSICLETIDSEMEAFMGQMIFNHTILTCGHMFHNACLSKYIEGSTFRCPNCRKEFNTCR